MSSSLGATTDTVPARTWRKVGVRIIPLIGVAYVMSYIDRANLGYIASPMSRDLHLDSGQVGLAAGLFFIGYILVEVPSNLALRRFGARKWVTWIMLTRGVATAATAAVNSATALYLARLLLGFAEAGLAAGILLYLTLWFPRRQRSWALSGFFLMIPVSSIVGSPLAAALLAWPVLHRGDQERDRQLHLRAAGHRGDHAGGASRAGDRGRRMERLDGSLQV